MGETTNEGTEGAIGAGASKPPTEPQQSGVEEAHILEEHIVAPPAQKTPATTPVMPPVATSPAPAVQPQKPVAPPAITPSAPPVSPPPQTPRASVSVVPPAEPKTPSMPPHTTLQSGVAMAASTMATLLEKIKLPERRDAQAKPAAEPKKYDTSLVTDTKTAEEKAAAQEAAIATARAITEKMPETAPQGDVRALHTLKDDLQNVVRDKKISLVRAVALEEEKRHHGSVAEEKLEVQVQKERRTRFSLFLAALLFVVGLIAIGSVLFIMSERTQKAAAPITATVLFSEQSVPLAVDALAPADVRRSIGNARASSLTLGAILQIVPVMQKVVNGQSVTVPVTFGEFLEKIGAHAPPELARSLSDTFFLGLHTVDENAPIIVVPVTSYERAFAAMLAWEPNMNSDLAPMFTPVSSQAVGQNGLPVERKFEDTVMRNYDVRALKDDSGTIQLYYSFPTRNILIIAESPYSFSEILSRLRADRKL